MNNKTTMSLDEAFTELNKIYADNEKQISQVKYELINTSSKYPNAALAKIDQKTGAVILSKEELDDWEY